MTDTTHPDRDDRPAGMGINGLIPGAGRCVIADCQTGCGTNLMCSTHWRQVPPPIQRQVYAELRRWNTDGITLDVLREAQWAAVEAVTP